MKYFLWLQSLNEFTKFFKKHWRSKKGLFWIEFELNSVFDKGSFGSFQWISKTVRLENTIKRNSKSRKNNAEF